MEIESLPVLEGFQRFFEPQEAEVSVDALPVAGTVPPWLTGTLVRNGPAYFGPVRHLLDGLAMLHKFAFTDGRVSYANRFLRTRAYRALREDGRIGYREFASDPCRKMTAPIASLFRSDFTDNASVNVIRLGKQLVALTETPMPIAFDPDTLETLGVAYDPPGRGVRSPTAHPHLDASGAMITLQVHFGMRSSYRIYSGQRLLAKIPVARPAYVHSFALTDRHVVIAEAPFRVRPLELAFARRPFIENYRWDAGQPTRFIVADLASGAVRNRWEAEAMFCFHHVNAFEDVNGDTVVDLCAYPDKGIIDTLYLDNLRTGRTPIPAGKLRRYRLSASGAVQEHDVSPHPFEWPRVNYRARNTRPYRFAYGAGATEESATIIRIDTASGEAVQWHENGCYPGEPVFVPAPRSRAEDDGVVLSVVFDSRADATFLLILDARDLTELARVQAPHRMPFGFHGNYFEA